jgi:hypothetical protein
LKEHGIQRKYSCSYSPQQNGVVERKNMHIVKIARAMLNEKNLPNYFWVEAIATTLYIMNQTPTAIVHGMTHSPTAFVEIVPVPSALARISHVLISWWSM